ncbi:regulatory protein RecX [Papillibacter cinnamivorans]|uniref:Regulatory protein RecX n=1 Tax=Papillibacter cinnamivorans DSM 12816 TaxID=1122930 RepID=A0A1W1ZI68_9FIRM|nr:regulatory protein RecX [Papillibacter cinnamivorans]SMC48210.1 regulatory protein [Papillibacter cinnamivorans DSM 12816]
MRLLRIEPAGRGRYLLHFEDGRTRKVYENALINRCLKPGAEISEEELGEMLRESAQEKARIRGAAMTGKRAYSKRELREKLEAKGESPEAAAEAADWLEKLGAVNDAEYAGAIVNRYSGRGYGERRLREELRRRGVPRELWEEALNGAQAPEESVDKLIAQKLRGKQPDRKELGKVTEALLRRGFAWEEIAAGLRRYGEDVTD